MKSRLSWTVLLLFCVISITQASTYGYAEFRTSKFKLSVEENFGEQEDGGDTEEAEFFSLHGTVTLRVLGQRLYGHLESLLRQPDLPIYYDSLPNLTTVYFDAEPFWSTRVKLTFAIPESLSQAEIAQLSEVLSGWVNEQRWTYNFENFLFQLGYLGLSGNPPREKLRHRDHPDEEYTLSFNPDFSFTLTYWGRDEDRDPYAIGHTGVWYMKDEKVLTLYLPSYLPEEPLCPCRERGDGKEVSFYIKDRLQDGFVLERRRG